MRNAACAWMAVLVCVSAPALMGGVAKEELDRRVRPAVGRFEGKVSLFAKNLDSGATYGLREDEPVRTASTIKLPIMAAVFAAVEAGKAKWEEARELGADDKVSGSGILGEFSTGLHLPLRDLVHLMIVVSDNTATNLLLDRFTADYVNEQLAGFGLEQTRAMRKILGDGKNLKPEPGGLSREGREPENRRFGIGRSTPREMVTLLEKLSRGEIVSTAASGEMIEILKRQQYKDGIGRRTGEMTVASKSGALDRLRSDVGIVWSKGGRIAIAITCDDMPRTDYSEENAGKLLIAELTMLLIEGLQK